MAGEADNAGEVVDPAVEQLILDARGRGRPLPGSARQRYERGLGADLGAVRLHTDHRADVLNLRLRSYAVTAGVDVFFRRGEYDPASGADRELLGHELVHVVQQANGTAPLVQRMMKRKWQWNEKEEGEEEGGGEKKRSGGTAEKADPEENETSHQELPAATTRDDEPEWFSVSGDRDYDLWRLEMTLVHAAEERESTDRDFYGLVRNIKKNAVAKMYDVGMSGYPEIEDFVKACTGFYPDDKAWEEDRSGRLGLILDDRDLPRRLNEAVAGPPAFPHLPETGEKELHDRGASLHEVGKGGVKDEYDKPWLMTDAGIWTDHMGPCITVGLTAQSADRKHRYNALLHSFRFEFGGADIIDALRGVFNPRYDLPAYDSLVDPQWFVVGGSPDDISSVRKATELAEELRDQGLPVVAAQFTTHNEHSGKSKAVMITAAGEVSWTIY